MESRTEEKLKYLLVHLDDFIEKRIYDVLEDSDTDPEYSAVTTLNLIHCYLSVAVDLGIEECTDTVKYMHQRCFSQEEISKFMVKKEKEASYYIGKQYE